MKILFVSQYFYPESFKGNDIVFDLIKKGHDVTVFTGKPNYPLGVFYEGYGFWGIKTEFINGAKVIRVPTYPRKNGNAINLIFNYLSFIFFAYPVCLFKMKDKYDLFFVQQLSPVTMALPAIWLKNKNTPVFLWVLDLWPESLITLMKIQNRVVTKVLDSLVSFIYFHSDFILTSSRSFEKSIRLKTGPDKEIFYFPNWAEDVYTKGENQIKYNFDLPQGFNIVFAGNVGEAQDFETILKAAKLTSEENINWNIIGDGRKLNWVRKFVSDNGLTNVFIHGKYPLEAMPELFKKADIMLLTLADSPAFNLTVPAKLQAYMASGKIVLGAINGEAQSIINDNKIGIASEAGNYTLLAKNAIVLKKLPENERIDICKRAIDLYNNQFSKETLLNNLEYIFKTKINA